MWSNGITNSPMPFKGKSAYFFVVWSFLLFGLFGCYFFCCLGGGGFFLLFGRGPRPRPNSKKKKHAPAQTAKKKTRPRPFGVCFFLAVWAGGWVYFFKIFGQGACPLFCCLGGGRVLCFAVWAGACSFFAVWAGACSFFCLGRGRVFFLLFGRGTGVHSLTRLPGSSLSDPTTEETEQQKKNTGS